MAIDYAMLVISRYSTFIQAVWAPMRCLDWLLFLGNGQPWLDNAFTLKMFTLLP